MLCFNGEEKEFFRDMKYDVVVVGAGPAGATATKFLAEKGVRVLLLDKQTFPRDKPCGGALPVRVLKRFPYIEKNNLIDSFSSSLCFHSSSLKYNVNVLKNEPIIAMVIRNTFDAGLVDLAFQSGAILLEGKTASYIKTNKEHAQVTLNDGTTIDTSYVIAADGIWSAMTKQLGGIQKNQNIGICIVEEYPVSKLTMDHFFGTQRCVHFHVNIFGIAGYGWVFPKKEHVNIGLGEFRHAIKPELKKNLKALYPQYINLLKEHKIIPETLQIRTGKGGVFPTVPIERTYGSRTVLCGDAGGLTNPLTGEGIYYAMVSGEIASKAILKALENGFTNEQALSVYQHDWMDDFGKDHKRFFRISKGWKADTENLLRLLEKDTRIIDIALSVLLEPKALKKIRGKIMRHLLYIYTKDRLGLLD
jgi:geranylgeranyl reductase family protein